MDEKAIASAISAKLGDAEEAEPGEADAEIEVTAGNVMSALKDNNPSAFAAALKDFIKVCM